jgi:hypothetical protein
MKPTLKQALKHRVANKAVPYTFVQSPQIAAMPKMFAKHRELQPADGPIEIGR